MTGHRLFVTGAESFVGRALQQACAEAGVAFTGMDAASSQHRGVVKGDIRAPDLADMIPADTTAVVHLAALSRDPDCRGRLAACFDINVAGSLNVQAAARARGVPQTIFASSEWVYGNGPFDTPRDEDSPIDLGGLTSEYALSKAVAEAALRQDAAAHGGALANLRFGIIYGPRPNNWSAVEALTHAVALQDEIAVGALATARRFIHVADISQALLSVLGRKGIETFNIQGPALTSLGDVIAAASAHLGRTPNVVETAPDAPSIRNIAADRITTATGWAPRISLADGIATLTDSVVEKAA